MWRTRASLSSPCSPGIWLRTVPHQVKTGHLRSSQSLDVRIRNRLNQGKTAPRCHRVTRRAGCQKATTELSLQNLQSLSHQCYPTDTRQLTSSQGEADGVSDKGMTLQAWGGWICLAVGTASEGSSLLPEDENTHTHTHLNAFKKELIHLVEMGVLSPQGASEWASPMCVIPPKDGRVRWVSDFRESNKLVKRKQYPLPIIWDILHQRKG